MIMAAIGASSPRIRAEAFRTGDRPCLQRQSASMDMVYLVPAGINP